MTKDGVLVISHDPFLNPDLVRGPDGRWLAGKGPPIHTLTLAELKRYDIGRLDPASAYARQFPEQRAGDGERFPTLAEVFALVQGAKPTGRLNIETKITPDSAGETVDAETFARLTVDAIREAGFAGDATIQSFDWRTLVAAKKLRAGHRDGLPHDRNRRQRHGPARVGHAVAVARRPRSSRPTTARCRAPSRRRAAAPGRRSGAT